MGKKYKNIYDEIADMDNIRLAYDLAVCNGNRYTNSHLIFKDNLEANLYEIYQELKNETYKIGEYHSFYVYEPKKRIIHSLPFKDRVVQHAINNIINPIFEKTFYSFSYACRKEKGTHRGVKDTQSKIRQLTKKGKVYYLKMDFSKYFHRINIQILLTEIKRKISDSRVIKLLMFFMDRLGIPIGNLLSQLFANIYGHIFDRFIKTKLKAKEYFRYMDDTVILSNNKLELIIYQKKLEKFIHIFMKLNFSKWYINEVETKPLNFLGYRITSKYKLVRKDSIVRAKRKIKKYTKQNDLIKLNLFLASWGGHIKSADSFNLVNFINKEMQNARIQQKTAS